MRNLGSTETLNEERNNGSMAQPRAGTAQNPRSKIRNPKSGGILCDVKWKLACQVWNLQALG